MSTPEMQLISRIVREGQPAFTTSTRWGICEADFKSTETRVHWQHILGINHAQGSQGSVPGIHSFRTSFPTFELCDDISMATEMLCSQVRNNRLQLELKALAAEIIEEAAIDPVAAAARLTRESSQLLEMGSQKSTDVTFPATFGEIIHDYDLMRNGVVTAKATWPWQSFNDATYGLQEDDYIVFYGRPKSMKSWALCAFLAHLFDTDKKIVFYTKEMTPKNMFKRIASCLAQVPYNELRGARLTVPEYQSLLDAYMYVQSRANSIICLSGRDAPTGGDTVQWLRSKVEYYKPDVVAIDGMYLMSAAGGSKQRDDQRVLSISREISQMRLDLRTPVIATVQANRKAASHSGAELDEIAYSDAIGQDATCVVRVINEKCKPTIALVVGGSREFALSGVRIGGIPSTDFFEKETLSAKEVHRAKEGDVGEADAAEDHAVPRRRPRTSKGEDEVANNIAKAMDSI